MTYGFARKKCLRAFLKKIKNMKKIILFLIFTLTKNVLLAQSLTFSAASIPYEIKFADVNFQFSEQARSMLVQEVGNYAKNKEARLENMKKVSLTLPYIEPLVDDLNLPVDFKYMTNYVTFQKNMTTNVVLETGVLWCLDMLKAEAQGLNVDENLDERKHLELATRAAASSIRKSYSLYENWGTALYAHLVSKDVLQTLNIANKWNGESIAINSTKYSALIQFLAYKYVTELEFNSYKPTEKKIFYLYRNPSQKSLSAIATELRVDQRELQKYNGWLKSGTPPAEYIVFVPTTMGKVNDVKATSETRKPSTVKKEMDAGFPILKPAPTLAIGHGGSFYKINSLKGVQAETCDDFVNLSYKGDLNTKLFLKYNDLTAKDPLILGNVYYLQPKKSKGEIPFHIVRGEESMWDVSQRYGVKLDVLLKNNRMPTNSKLEMGRVVYLQQIRPKDKQIEYIDVPKEEQYIKGSDDNIDVVAETTVPKRTAPKSRVPQDVEESPRTIPKSTSRTRPVVEEDADNIESTTTTVRTTPKKQPVPVKPEPVLSADNRANKNNRSYSEKLGDAVLERDATGKYMVHNVRQGDTLYRISKNYNVSLDQLYKLNNLKTTLIEIGDRIIVKKY
jgi:membrane-bound lytic murein transglycosylase D